MRVFVQDVQKSYLPAITGFVFNKIITPYMILVLSSQADAAAICQPESALLYLLFRQLQTFFPPDSFYTFVVDQNAFIPKHIGNHPIPDSTVIGNQSDDRGMDLVFVSSLHRLIPATVAVDLQYPASPSFCYMMFVHDIFDGRYALSRA